MGKVVGTTAGESMVAAANIFIGQTEAPLMIKPFLGKMNVPDFCLACTQS